jgi:hypothetical protein
MIRKLLALTLFSIIFSCSGSDDDQQTIETPTSVTGSQFDLIVDGSPISATLDKAIIDGQGVPYENVTAPLPQFNDSYWTDDWFQGGAFIKADTRIGIRLIDVVNHLKIGLYQHQQYVTVGQPRVVYQLDFNDFQVQDYVEFNVGGNAVITGFKIYRYYNGGSLDDLNSNVLVFQGTVTQL